MTSKTVLDKRNNRTEQQELQKNQSEQSIATGADSRHEEFEITISLEEIAEQYAAALNDRKERQAKLALSLDPSGNTGLPFPLPKDPSGGIVYNAAPNIIAGCGPEEQRFMLDISSLPTPQNDTEALMAKDFEERSVISSSTLMGYYFSEKEESYILTKEIGVVNNFWCSNKMNGIHFKFFDLLSTSHILLQFVLDAYQLVLKFPHLGGDLNPEGSWTGSHAIVRCYNESAYQFEGISCSLVLPEADQRPHQVGGHVSFGL